MVTANDAAARARWQVVWINPKNNKVVRKDFGDDFHEAMKVYTRAVELGARATTLRCKNMSFPPPEKWRPRMEPVLNARGKPTGEQIKHEPLEGLNRQGTYWCPYCIKFRKFRHRDGYYTTEGVWMAEPALVCPMCHIEHTAFYVKFWNPLARVITDAQLSAEGRSRNKRKRRAAIMED